MAARSHEISPSFANNMLKIENDKSQWETMKTLLWWINYNHLHDKIHPFVVDIGAADGVLNSNSWILTTINGWGGLLVEPNPTAFNKLQSYYDMRTGRGGDIQLENSAISESNGTITLRMPENEDDDQLASITQRFPKKVEVNSITIKNLLDKHNVGQVGILSVDTEGYDFYVLKMWMETDNRPQIVITESWPHMAYMNIMKSILLKKNNYSKIFHLGENEIFINQGLYDS